MKKQMINLNPIKNQIKEELIKTLEETTFMNTDRVSLTCNVSDMLDEYLKDKQISEPQIYIEPEAYLKMRLLVDKESKEVGWYGTVEQPEGLDNVYVITDILVYPQTVTGATVEQDESRMFNFEMGLTTEQVNSKRFHGHSHVNMGTSPSGVDETFYQDILTQVTDYFIITITNKKNEYTTRFYDIKNNIMYSDVPIQLIDVQGTSLLDWYDTQKDQVKERVSTISTKSHNSIYNNIGSKSKYKSKKNKSNKSNYYNASLDLGDDYDSLVWDPQLYQYISKDEYKKVYGRDYDGDYDYCYQNKYRRDYYE